MISPSQFMNAHGHFPERKFRD